MTERTEIEGFEETEDARGHGIEDLLEIQKRVNEMNNLIAHHMQMAYVPPPRCPCGKAIFEHCVYCGACSGEKNGDCTADHLAAPKYGYANDQALDAELILEDILDAEFIE